MLGMKRLTAMVLVLLALMGMCARAVEGEPFLNVEPNAVYAADLNGDGANEDFMLSYREEDDAECLWLQVTDANGAVSEYRTCISTHVGLWLTVYDSLVVVITGYDADNVAYTYILRYSASRHIQELMFSADSREKVPEEYFTACGYGLIASMNRESITLESDVDVLGTWPALRTYRFSENGRFVMVDGLWETSLKPDNPDVWSYPALTAVKEIEYTDDNGETDALQAGTRILITATDKESIARFVTQDGKTGTLSIYPANDSDIYLFSINDVPETDLFRFVPYTG